MKISSLLTVGSEKARPRIRLSGFHLKNYGFEVDSLVSVHFEPCKITLKLEGKGLDTYRSIVKDVIKNNGKLLYIKQEYANKKLVPFINLKGLWLQELGYEIGDVLIKKEEQGLITLWKLDLSKIMI